MSGMTGKGAMSLRVLKAEATPNPLATKYVLSGSVAPLPGVSMRAYRTVESAAADPLGSVLMAIPGVTSVLVGESWVTLNRTGSADARALGKSLEAALARCQ